MLLDDHQLKNQEPQEEKNQDKKEEFMQVDYPDNAQADNVKKDDGNIGVCTVLIL